MGWLTVLLILHPLKQHVIFLERVHRSWRGMPWYGGGVPPRAESVWGDLLEDQAWSAETWRTHIVEPTLLRPPNKCQVAKEVNCKLVETIF